MPLNFGTLQSQVVDLIAAHALFASEAVVANLGDKDREIEQALTTRGIVVEVLQVLGAKYLQGTQGLAHVRATVAVRIKVNPEVNDGDGGAGINIYSAVTAVVQAVFGYQKTTGEKPFEAEADDFISSWRGDDGLIAYDIMFAKQVTL